MKIILGKIASVFGLKGQFECFLYSDIQPSWKTARLADSDIVIKLDKYPHRSKKDRSLCSIEGDPFTPEQLKHLVGKEFWIYRNELPQISSDEVYLCDLIGRPLIYLDKEIGYVVSVHDFGAGIVLEIAQADDYRSINKENQSKSDKKVKLDEESLNDGKEINSNEENNKSKKTLRTKKEQISKKTKPSTIFIHWNEIKLEKNDILLSKG